MCSILNLDNGYARLRDGAWKVERLGGFLPPMVGVWKRTNRAGHGETWIGPSPIWPFRCGRTERGVTLVYRWPFSGFVDELRPEPDGSWVGRSTLLGFELGTFRMVAMGHPEGGPKKSGQRGGESMDQQSKLRRKVIEYLQNVHAMEQNVSLMLDSIILNTRDRELKAMFREHKSETRRQERRLYERLQALGGLGLSAASKDLTAMASAQVKGLIDLWRVDKAVRNARDAFVTEHLEIAAYEILERLARRAGDVETAEVARANRTEEEAMARRIASNWDRVVDATLAPEGPRVT